MARVKCQKCGHVNADAQSECASCGAGLPKIQLKAKTQKQEASAAGSQFSRGQVVANRYTVQQLIGRGGMGCIYRVHDNVLGEVVALKTLLPQFVKDKVVVERFFNEAKIARRLAHPGIVRVHDIGSADSTVYISMEFLAGRSLRAILDSLPLGARLPLSQVLKVFDELCSALEYAHRFTIHRDIKPENVMVMDDGSVKLMDFGISKLMANTRLTGASVVMGTPFYMSPEQLRNSRDVDQRADVYSVGVMLYEVLTGNLPTGVPKPASQLHAAVPPDLDTVIEKCVDPEPENRYRTAADLRAALRPILERATEREMATVHREQQAANPGSPRGKLVGALLCAGVVIVMLLGLAVAENARAALLAQRMEAAGEVDERAGAWRLMEHLQARALPLAELQTRRYPDAKTLLEQANELWARAKAGADGGNLATAMADGNGALQCYLGVAMWQPSMTFIPPGITTIGDAAEAVPAFFMDTTEVTIGEYRDFCEDTGGEVFTMPPELAKALANPKATKYPMHLVTGYEAMAYAAQQGKQLPTEAQWLRAAYGDNPGVLPWAEDPGDGTWMATLHPAGDQEAAADISPFGCRDMFLNLSEWTASIAGAPAQLVPQIGDALMVCGGHFRGLPADLARPSREIPFHMRSDEIGFRCILPVPNSLGGMDAKLSELAALSQANRS